MQNNLYDTNKTNKKIDVHAYLQDVQEKVDKTVDVFVVVFLVLGFLFAPIYNTWKFTLVVGVSNTLIYLVARYALKNKFWARMVISVVLAVFVLQYIGQVHGMAELHFFFFTNIAILILYQDWRVILPYTIITVLHHALLAFFQWHLGMQELSLYFISYGDITLMQMSFHFGIVSLMAFIAILWSVMLRNQTLKIIQIQAFTEEQNAQLQLSEKRLQEALSNTELEVQNRTADLKGTTEELLASEEELRQNLEELQSTQEQLTLSNYALEGRMMAINETVGYMELDTNKKILQINDKLATCLQYTPAELVGTSHERLVESDYATSPEYAQFWADLQAGKVFSEEFLRIAKDGKKVWIYASYCPIKDERGKIQSIIKLAIDITENKENLQKILNSEKNLTQLSLVASKTNNGVVIADKDGMTLWINEAFTFITGYELHEVSGKKLGAILQGKDTDPLHVQKIREGLASKDSFTQEILNYHKHGYPYWLLLSITPILDEAGEVIQFIGIETDITARKQAQAKDEIVAKKVQLHNKIIWQLTTYNFENAINLQKIYELITSFATEGLQAERCSIWLYGEGNTSIICQNLYQAQKHNSEPTTLYEKDFPIYFQSVRDLSYIAANDAHTHPATAEFSTVYLTPLGINTMLDVPIVVNGITIGVVCVEGYAKNHEWMPEDIVFGQSLANFITLATQTIARKKANNEMQVVMKHTEKQKIEIEKALQNLKETQNQLIQSEKMASLGQLVASVAHEINTPLGAIRSSIHNVNERLQQTLTELPDFFLNLPEADRQIFVTLLNRVQPAQSVLSSRELRKIKFDLTAELEEQNIADAEDLAVLFSELGIYALHAHQDLLQSPNLSILAKMLYKMSGIQRSANTIETATDRASKVIFALKNFSRQDHEGEKVATDINESIDTVLTIYHNQIKQGIEVMRKFGNLPAIACFPDELMQVWTNLIHNAMHAMVGKGILTVETQIKDSNLLVSVTDTGHGIPEEIQAKIFNAFFTTKKLGEGSGLGLDIVKKIIDKHAGKIWFESEAGKGTTFFVEIPIQP